ncbi:LuxR family transcriptional regulator [Actinoplanes bogorensis]|uniref:LuxR family transcriptional regulator n=1 Tax=Paractinoplanes bogorensis TaxID=1610840 RepID=A0ABS5YMB9_9ACTN|nr:LuxR family transcriptional regulator [Actinoplanes bogorensis]MBU2664601.1 LuxR family transcriptional regulator [Actinoplanes bogorensis]
MQDSFPYGRQAERSAIRTLLDTPAGGSLVLVGGPGEGRTTLLGTAAGMAGPGWTVLTAPGRDPSVGYAGLQQLIEPLEALAGHLPAHQRDPLTRVIAGREPGASPLLLGVALLALMRRAAARGPVLCLLDDADRLDPPSWQLIQMLAARLPVAILATAAAELPGLRCVHLTPLDDEAGHALVHRRAPETTDEVAAALVELAAGHAGALAELADSLTPAQRRGLAPLPGGLPHGSSLRRRFQTRLAALPPSTRRLLLLAAAAPGTPPAELLAAADPALWPGTPSHECADSALVEGVDAALVEGVDAAPVEGVDAAPVEGVDAPSDEDADRAACGGPGGAAGECACGALREGACGAVTAAHLAPAERAGLITVTADGVSFRPPVAGLVAYGEEPLFRRHAAHLALAVVFAKRGRELAALVQRAEVTSAPDGELAQDLMRAAASVPPADAWRAQRHAARLGDDPSALLAAARSAVAAGRPRDARPLLRQASRLRAGVEVRARARGAIAEIKLRGAPAESRDVLLDVAADLLPTDPTGALDALLLAADACGRAGDPSRYPALARQAAAHYRDPSATPFGRPGDPSLTPFRRPGDPSATSLGKSGDPGWEIEMALHQVIGLADLMTGDETSAFRHLRAVMLLAARTTDPVALTRAANTGILLGQDRRAAHLANQAVTQAQRRGHAALVPEALEVAAFAELAAGRYDAATENALDGAAVARGAGRPDLAVSHQALLGLLAAFMGDAETARQRGDAGTVRRHDTATARERGGAGDGLGDWTEALLDLAAGHPDRAAERLARVARTGSMILRVAIAPHLAETTGKSVDVFDRWAARTAQPGWLALRSRCRALTEAEGADDYFREALGWHDRDADGGFARAHTQLLYGRHLRRHRRPAEARDHLRRAAETFRRYDARPWTDQAARELRAAGERVTTVDQAPLTAQQERIAGLVAEGATNREVARQLHLSPRTIDHHLRNVFARLGVRSRTELARRLDLFDRDRRDQAAVPVAHDA